MAEEVDYESDPEEAKLSLKMRRRVASDDEDEDGGGGEERREKLVSRIESDVESGEGEAADYDEDEEYLEEEEEYFEDEGLLEVEGVYVEERVEIPRGRKVDDVVGGYGEFGERLEVGVIKGNVNDGGKEWGDGVGGEKEGEGEGEGVGEGEGEREGEGEKKEQEPYSVPTAGAFYMHDDRFRDNARGGRHRYN